MSIFDVSVGWLGRFDNFKRSREDDVGVWSLLDCGECYALFGSGFDVWFFPRLSVLEVGGWIANLYNFYSLGGVVCVCAVVFVIILVENFPLSAGLLCVVGVSEVVIVSFLSSLSEAFISLIKFPQSFASSWINVLTNSSNLSCFFFFLLDCLGIGSRDRLYYHLPCFIIKNIIFIFYWENFLFSSSTFAGSCVDWMVTTTVSTFIGKFTFIHVMVRIFLPHFPHTSFPPQASSWCRIFDIYNISKD